MVQFGRFKLRHVCVEYLFVVCVQNKMAEEEDDSNNFVSPLHRDPEAFLNAKGNKDEESSSSAPHRVNIFIHSGSTKHARMRSPGLERPPI